MTDRPGSQPAPARGGQGARADTSLCPVASCPSHLTSWGSEMPRGDKRLQGLGLWTLSHGEGPGSHQLPELARLPPRGQDTHGRQNLPAGKPDRRPPSLVVGAGLLLTRSHWRWWARRWVWTFYCWAAACLTASRLPYSWGSESPAGATVVQRTKTSHSQETIGTEPLPRAPGLSFSCLNTATRRPTGSE